MGEVCVTSNLSIIISESKELKLTAAGIAHVGPFDLLIGCAQGHSKSGSHREGCFRKKNRDRGNGAGETPGPCQNLPVLVVPAVISATTRSAVLVIREENTGNIFRSRPLKKSLTLLPRNVKCCQMSLMRRSNCETSLDLEILDITYCQSTRTY